MESPRVDLSPCLPVFMNSDVFADSQRSRSQRSSRDRSRHKDYERSREQRERDMLSFEKIRVRDLVKVCFVSGLQ